eukprot:s157_g32.t1
MAFESDVIFLVILGGSVVTSDEIETMFAFADFTPTGLGMSSDDEKVAMRISKRQRAVRHLLRRCLQHSLPVPDDLSYLARAVTDWGNFQADFMSKRTFEKLMSDSRREIAASSSEKLTPEELEIEEFDVQDQTATSVSKFQ